MAVRELKPILERANITRRLQTLRDNLAELEAISPRTPIVAARIQRIQGIINHTKREYITLVYSKDE